MLVLVFVLLLFWQAIKSHFFDVFENRIVPGNRLHLLRKQKIQKWVTSTLASQFVLNLVRSMPSQGCIDFFFENGFVCGSILLKRQRLNGKTRNMMIHLQSKYD